MLTLEELEQRGRRRLDRHGHRRVHRHAGPAHGQAPPRRVLRRGARRASTASRAATTCSRSTWRWIRSRATGSRAGSRATATSSCGPTWPRLRRIPWLEATALVLCDVAWHDGTPVAPSPRQVLKRQVERAAELGYSRCSAPSSSSTSSRRPTRRRTRSTTANLTPSVPYILDYHILATTYDEPLIRQIRNGMQGGRHQGRDLEGRGLARASRRSTSASPTRSRWPTTTRSTRTAPRRSRT